MGAVQANLLACHVFGNLAWPPKLVPKNNNTKMRATWKRTFDFWVRPASSCRTRRDGSVRNLLRRAPHPCRHLRQKIMLDFDRAKELPNEFYKSVQINCLWNTLHTNSNQFPSGWSCSKWKLNSLISIHFQGQAQSHYGTVTWRTRSHAFWPPKWDLSCVLLLAPSTWRTAGPPPKNSWDCQFCES